jgi:hypothetical protein
MAKRKGYEAVRMEDLSDMVNGRLKHDAELEASAQQARESAASHPRPARHPAPVAMPHPAAAAPVIPQPHAMPHVRPATPRAEPLPPPNRAHAAAATRAALELPKQ